MEKEISQTRVTAIVPAYNEASRIGLVIETLLWTNSVTEIIVVDDGSDDGTWEVVTSYPVIAVRTAKRSGKATAMDLGVSKSNADIVFFCDADVHGLTEAMIETMIAPVVEGAVEMFIGMRNRKILFLKSILHFVPHLGGERAMRKSLWNRVPSFYKHAFRIETALNYYATRHGQGYEWQLFPGLTQTIKEKKYGFWKGLKQRISMMADILFAQCVLSYEYTVGRIRESTRRISRLLTE